MIRTVIILIAIAIGFIACKEKKIEGETFTISGYLTPDVSNLDSVLKNQDISIVTDQSNTNLNDGAIQTYFISTDSNGLFTFSYSNPDYYEDDGNARKKIDWININIVRDNGEWLGNSFQKVPPQCNLEEVNIVPGDTGWVMLANICADR